MTINQYKTPPEVINQHFAVKGGLFRLRADNSYRVIESLSGGRLSTLFDGERLDGADISWCLHYGNWPKYHLAQVDGNPHNVEISNLFPVRIKPIRFRAALSPKGYCHPLAPELPHRTVADCRKHWAHMV